MHIHTVGVIYDTVYMEVAITQNWCDKHFKCHILHYMLYAVLNKSTLSCIFMTYSVATVYGELLQEVGDE